MRMASGKRATFEYAFVLVSFSQTLKRSMSASIFLRASVNGCLSLTWSPVIHDLICSRKLCRRVEGRMKQNSKGRAQPSSRQDYTFY